MLKYVVLIITLEVCVDIYSWRLLQFKCQIETNLQVYAVHDANPGNLGL